jgi:hemolysin activation/secretion protein
MTRKNFSTTGRQLPSGLISGLAIWLLLCFCRGGLLAAEPAVSAGSPVTADAASMARRYAVQSYVIEGRTSLATNRLVTLLASHTGTNVSLDEIVRAAVDLQTEYSRQGFTAMNIVIAEKRIANGIVTMVVFPGAFAQIVVSGRCYWRSGHAEELAAIPSAPAVVSPAEPVPMPPVTNAIPPAPPPPATPAQIAQAEAELLRQMAVADFTVKPKDPRIHVVSTNAGPRFAVQKYLVNGNTVLTPGVMGNALTNIDGAFGTNVSFDGIRTAVRELQGAYRERGFVTVSVGVPQQKLTNGTVKLQVTEGRLASIEVKGNRYFNSENVMRALPSLHTNLILNGLIFQDELNQANANQDRQIYPVIAPGLEPGTSDLTLKVKDQLPLHGKVDFNNESSPGTPPLRVNSSVVYNNLWQRDNSFGIQYNFSPQQYKTVPSTANSSNSVTHQVTSNPTSWNIYDQPLIATYSGFYRLPLGGPRPVEDIIAEKPGTFGYNEATRRFNLPPPSGQPELNFFASRATIDTGFNTLSSKNLYSTNGNSLDQTVVQQSLTVNNDLGFRLSLPAPSSANFHAGFSGGLDFKTYQSTTYQTNVFTLNSVETNVAGGISVTNVSVAHSPVPTTINNIRYLPLALRYDATMNGSAGLASFGLGLSGNVWYSGTLANLQGISGSSKSSGHWVVFNPSFTWAFAIQTNWTTTLRADGQWASEPLISNEQFGIGGVNSVRGYHEGEEFGDTGWHGSIEQQTPPHLVGYVAGNAPLMIRGTVFMDGAKEYLLDPQGRPGSTALWGTGFGGVATVGSHWQARFLFSLPLLETTTTKSYQPFFNFDLTAQF